MMELRRFTEFDVVQDIVSVARAVCSLRSCSKESTSMGEREEEGKVRKKEGGVAPRPCAAASLRSAVFSAW